MKRDSVRRRFRLVILGVSLGTCAFGCGWFRSWHDDDYYDECIPVQCYSIPKPAPVPGPMSPLPGPALAPSNDRAPSSPNSPSSPTPGPVR